MKIVFETNNGLEAEEIHTFLKAYNIESVIVGKSEDRSAAFSSHPEEALIRVMVIEENYDEAMGLINSSPKSEAQEETN